MLPGGQGAMGYINSVSMSTSEGGIEGGWLRRTQDFNISQQEAETSQGSDIYSLVTGSRKNSVLQATEMKRQDVHISGQIAVQPHPSAFHKSL